MDERGIGMGELRQKPPSLLRDDRGRAFLEFAFAAPILFTLTFGVIDMGRVMWMNTTLDHAAREGARYASLHGSESSDPVGETEVVAYVKNHATGFADRIAVDVSWTPSNASGGSVTVEVTGRFDFLLLGFLPIGPIDLSGNSTRTVL